MRVLGVGAHTWVDSEIRFGRIGTFLSFLIKEKAKLPGQCGSVDEHRPTGHRLDSWSGYMLGFFFSSIYTRACATDQC